MGSIGMHLFLIMGLITLAIVIMKTNGRRYRDRQNVHKQAERVANAADHAGGYDNLIDLEFKRRQNNKSR